MQRLGSTEVHAPGRIRSCSGQSGAVRLGPVCRAVLPAVTLLTLAGCTPSAGLDPVREALRVSGDGTTWDPSEAEGLPGPAQRMLLRAIATGTPLASSVELHMEGTMVLEPGSDPLPFRAHQLLAPPRGFLWSAEAGRGLARIDGFDRYLDGEGEMRWSIRGLIPVIRAGGEDVTRSAAGRLAMEAILLPSALLPGPGISWQEVDEGAARFTMSIGDEVVETLVEVDPEGRPTRVSALRWSEAAGPGYDRFVVELSGELEVDGYRIPSRIEAGWRLGEPDEFRFFRAELLTARFR